ncbi:MAG: stage II sporulation protein P [Clostridia bacterium]|nr:stage II sporulation protein P [Clostridia bacterium]
MTGNQKKLRPPKETPLLSPAEIEYRVEKNARKIGRWYRIYLATAVGVAVLTVIFIIIGITQGNIAKNSPTLENIASAFLSGELMELSGNAPPYNKDEVKDNYNHVFDVVDGILIPSKDPDSSGTVVTPDKPTENDPSSIYDFDYSKIPAGETAIIPMDLSLSSQGADYIYNSTGYTPNTKALLAANFTSSNSPSYISTNAPLVLIIHTHGTESYSKNGAISYIDNGGEIARSENTSENVVAVGAVMAEILNKKGIPTLHCAVMHDRIQYKDSYSRAEETIKQYLEKYPSIKLVIDLHRDAVVKSTGELVRPVTEVNSKPTAQLMCVVGSDWGGDACPSWQNNLSLALKLRDSLNKKYGNLCRPAYLRSSTYNQELSPFSLLLEVGACGNSLEEAKNAAILAAEELVPLIKMM